MENTYQEVQPWGITSYTMLKNSFLSFQTKKAKIDLFTNPYFGRMLFIDGVLQSTTADEHLYHQKMVLKGMEYRKQERILIAGGAEGALLREIQDHDTSCDLGVKEIVMVDWDQELVEYLRDEEPWSRGSFDDERLRLIFDNIESFLQTNIQPFDTVFLDLLDPNTKEEMEWLCGIVEKSITFLHEKGGLIMNAGSNQNRIDECILFLQEKFPHKKIEQIKITVPSFQEISYFISIS
jgi:spermidine synthase